MQASNSYQSKEGKSQWQVNLDQIQNAYLTEKLKSTFAPLFGLLGTGFNRIHEYFIQEKAELDFFYALYLSLYIDKDDLYETIKGHINVELLDKIFKAGGGVLGYFCTSSYRVMSDNLQWLQKELPFQPIFRGNICKKPEVDVTKLESVSMLKGKDEELFIAIRSIQKAYKQFVLNYVFSTDQGLKNLEKLSNTFKKMGFSWIIEQYQMEIGQYLNMKVNIEPENAEKTDPMKNKQSQTTKWNKMEKEISEAKANTK